MSQTLQATFDGQVLYPDEPIQLAPNTRVRITIETIEPSQPARPSFLQTARTLNLEGPGEWSEKIDQYLYEEGHRADE